MKFVIPIFLFMIGSNGCIAQNIRFNDPDIYLSLTKPKNWNTYNKPESFYLSPGRFETLPIIRFQYTVTHQPPEVDSYIQYMCEFYLPDNREEFELIEVGTDSLNSIEMRWYTYYQTQFDEKVITKVFTFWNEGRQFKLELISPVHSFTINEKIHLTTLKSIIIERK